MTCTFFSLNTFRIRWLKSVSHALLHHAYYIELYVVLRVSHFFRKTISRDDYRSVADQLLLAVEHRLNVASDVVELPISEHAAAVLVALRVVGLAIGPNVVARLTESLPCKTTTKIKIFLVFHIDSVTLFMPTHKKNRQ